MRPLFLLLAGAQLAACAASDPTSHLVWDHIHRDPQLQSADFAECLAMGQSGTNSMPSREVSSNASPSFSRGFEAGAQVAQGRATAKTQATITQHCMQGRGYRLTKYFGCLNLHAGDEIAQIERDYRTRVADVTEAMTVLEAQSPGHFEGLLEKSVATLTDSRRLQAQLVMQRAIENCQRN